MKRLNWFIGTKPDIQWLTTMFLTRKVLKIKVFFYWTDERQNKYQYICKFETIVGLFLFEKEINRA